MMMMMMLLLPAALTVISVDVSLFFIPCVLAHGYLKTPRSRNIIAYQDKNWSTFHSGNGANNDPEPEDCPHCLNRGGSLAQCGAHFGLSNNNPFERNYDTPHNSRGQPMPPNIQATYTAGSIIEIEIMVTTHHSGHFEFAICPIIGHDDDATTTTTNVATARTEAISSPTMPIPTKECFDENKLTFISDESYGAPQDMNYPERGYLAPASIANWTNGDPGEQPVYGAEYKMRFQLPTSSSSSSTSGDLVLLQWYYITANSCKHPGYAEYPFPAMWGKDVDLYPGLPDCENVPEDGNGFPEQFWNCAEIRIVKPTTMKPTIRQTRRPTGQPTPKPIRQTRRPTPRPTPKPTRRPSKQPTSRPLSYSILTLDQNTKPTRRPQQQPQRPRSPKPTRKPTTRRPTKNYVILSPSESFIVPISNNKPSKGQEQQQSSSSLGEMISNQITTAAANNKKLKRQQQLQKKQKQKLRRQGKKENILKNKKRQEKRRKRDQKKQSNSG